MADSLDRMAVTPTKVAQLTVPKLPELPMDVGRNPLSIMRFNREMADWRQKLERMISQLPIKEESA